MFDCPQCGEETETLHEGYCKECCEYNQKVLNDFNFRYDFWNSLTDNEKDHFIKLEL